MISAVQLQIRYQAEGLPRGITVAEWEVYEGLPMYSVYPEAKDAKSYRERGFFMYRDATEAEREEMNMARGRRRLSDAEREESRKRRREYLKSWHKANRKSKAA